MNKDIFCNLLKGSDKAKWDTCELLVEYFIKKDSCNIFKATQYADSSLSQFIDFVNQEYTDSVSLKKIPLFDPVTNENITKVNRSYFIVERIKEQIYSNISDKEFEKLCAKVFSKYFKTNYFNVCQSAGGGDGGYDFYLKTNLSKHPLFEIEIYGQAKQWKNNIGRPEIDKFTGALFKKKINKIHFLVFVTTSTFTEGALEYAESENIICLDGFQLSTMIFENNEKDCIEGKINEVIKGLLE